MARKIATLSLGLVCLMMVVGLSMPADATFTQDTIILGGTTDTESFADTQQLIDVATDSAGNLYVLHIHAGPGNDKGGDIRITKFDKDGVFSKVISVEENFSPFRIRRAALAVNKLSGAIYVAVADSIGAYLLFDTDAPLEDGQSDDFDSAEIPGYRLTNMSTIGESSPIFGFIDITVFGSTTMDSVFVVGVIDTAATTLSATAHSTDSGVKLWAFSWNGKQGVTDSAILYGRLRPADTTSTLYDVSDSVSVSAHTVVSNASILATGRRSISIVLQGVVARSAFELHQSATIADTSYDTGLFYDTFQILGSGVVVSDSSIDRIVYGYETSAIRVNSFQVSMGLDTMNNNVIVYYRERHTGVKLHRLAIPVGQHATAANDVDVGSGLSIKAGDTHYQALSFFIDRTGKEHIAIWTGDTIYYVKRDPAAGTQTTFDTVFSPQFGTARTTSDSVGYLGVLATNDGSPRIYYARVTQGGRFVHVGSPQSLALAAGSGIAVSNAQELTSTTASTTPSITLSIVPPVNDASTPRFAQIVITQPSSSNPASSSALSDFTTPTYSVIAPLGNLTGDTLTCDINSLLDGVSLYMRRPEDTTPSGGANSYDTFMFQGLTDSQITVLAGVMVKLRIGDTAGKMFQDDLLSDSGVAVRVKMVLTPSYLASLVAAGIDSSRLSIWKATGSSLSTSNDFTEVGASYTASDLHDGGNFTLTSSAITSFSFIIPALGSPAVTPGGGGVCILGRNFTHQPTLSAFRAMRDWMMSSRIGRGFAGWYYNLN